MTHIDLEYLRSLHVERGGTMSWNEIVKKENLPWSSEALRKKVQRYERTLFLNESEIDEYAGSDESEGEQGYVSTEVYLLRKEIERLGRLVKQQSSMSDEELLYEPYPPHLDDTSEWIKWQQDHLSDKEFVKIMVWSDIHFPDESHEALALAKNVLRIAKPDVLVYGGDMFDFDALSTFAKSRRRRYKDAVEEVSGKWTNLTRDVRKISPKTKQIAFRGNHDSRVDRWNDMAGNPFSDTTEEAFVNMVRSNGLVWWLGAMQETNIGCLFVQHGKRVGENAAKNAAKDNGWAMSMVQGHNHRPGVYIHRVNNPRNLNSYKIVTSVSSGALCNIPPHYQQDSEQSSWLNGIVVAHIDNVDDTVNLQNIVFHRRNDNGQMWTAYGDTIVTSS